MECHSFIGNSSFALSGSVKTAQHLLVGSLEATESAVGRERERQRERERERQRDGGNFSVEERTSFLILH